MFVWTIWASLMTANLIVVAMYVSRDVPYADEFRVLSNSRFTPAWLWEAYQVHRVPVAKLIWLGTLRLTDFDFRIGCCVNVALAGLAAAAMIFAARRRRGHTTFSDAFFPLVWLNSHGPLFLWFWTVSHLPSPLVAIGMLGLLISWRGDVQTRHLVYAGTGLVLLTLCGPGGFPYALALSVWLALLLTSGVSLASRHRWLLAGFVAVTVALVALYFVGWDSTNTYAPNRPGPGAFARTALQISGASLGTGNRTLWPWTGPAVLTLWLVSLGTLAAVWWRRPDERSRALGLGLFLSAGGGLVGLLGYLRGAVYDGVVFDIIYGLYAVPMLCGIFFVWELYGWRFARACVQIGLVAGLAILLPANARDGLQRAASLHDVRAPFQDDLHSGMSIQLLSTLHADRVIIPDARSLVSLRAARIGAFRLLPEPSDTQEVWIQVEPAALGGGTRRQSDLYEGPEPASSLVFRPPPLPFVRNIRLTFSYPGGDGATDEFRLYWRQEEHEPFSERLRSVQVEVVRRSETQTLVVPIEGRLWEFRVHPGARPWRWRISEIVLVLPVENVSDRVAVEPALMQGDVAVLDNDLPGYAQQSLVSVDWAWRRRGYGGSLRNAYPGLGAPNAIWEAVGVAPGRYEIQATWVGASHHAKSATYRIYDDSELVASVSVDQRQIPRGPIVGGSPFEVLAPVRIAKGRLRVVLRNDSDGAAIVDAIRVVRIE